jgi:quinol monooxygenase YgiN
MTAEVEIVRIPVEPARSQELVSVLQSARKGYLAAPACTQLELLRSAAGDEVAVILHWSSAQAHEQALQSADASVFFKALMGLASGSPEVRKYEPIGSEA